MLLPSGSDISSLMRKAEAQIALRNKQDRREWVVGQLMEWWRMPEAAALEALAVWLRSNREKDDSRRPVLVSRKRRAR